MFREFYRWWELVPCTLRDGVLRQVTLLRELTGEIGIAGTT